MDNESLSVAAAEHEVKITSLEHRVKDCEASLKDLTQLVRTVDKMAVTQQNMVEVLTKQDARLAAIENSPKEEAQYFKRVIISCLITGVMSAVLGALLAIII